MLLFVVGLILGAVVGSVSAYLIVLGILHLTENWRDRHGWL